MLDKIYTARRASSDHVYRIVVVSLRIHWLQMQQKNTNGEEFEPKRTTHLFIIQVRLFQIRS